MQILRFEDLGIQIEDVQFESLSKHIVRLRSVGNALRFLLDMFQNNATKPRQRAHMINQVIDIGVTFHPNPNDLVFFEESRSKQLR